MYANVAIFVAGVQSADRGATDRGKPPVRVSDGVSENISPAGRQSKGSSSGLKGCSEPDRLLSTIAFPVPSGMSSGCTLSRSGGGLE